MSNSKIWIDVTMLVNWTGQLTGIQRVEYNLAKRFSLQSNVAFCVFDKVSQKCSEFDFKHIEYKVSMLQVQTVSTGQSVNQSTVPATYRRIAKKLYLATVRVAPRKLTATAGRTYRALRQKSTVNQEQQVSFMQDDVFLILSGDWSDNLFADWVKSTRKASDIKVLQIVYDMLPYVQPAYFVEGMSKQFSDYMERMFNICDGLLAISKSTKRDIETFMQAKKIQNVPVEVFRLGDDFVKQKPVRPNIEVESGDFILCVGTIEARKNHALLYYAMREAMNKNIYVPPIVIVGKVGWLSGDFMYMVKHDTELSKKFVFLNYCTDQELAWLFGNCKFTVYPSYYEGWGLPIAESLYYGKYCLASESSSMPEIAGNFIDYFSPNDPVILLNKIQYYISNPESLKVKEERIKKDYSTTSWDDTFEVVNRFVSGFVN